MTTPSGVEARRAWLNLPQAVRDEAKQLAAHIQAHPDRAVRVAAVGWQRLQHRRAGRLGHLTSPQTTSLVGAPIGFAVLPREVQIKSALLSAFVRRGQGWIFFVDWHMDTPPEVVAATALRLHAASRQTPAPNSA